MRRLTLIALAILAMIALSGAVVTPPRPAGAGDPRTPWPTFVHDNTNTYSNGGTAVWDLSQALVAAGWTVTCSGGGTGSGCYDATGGSCRTQAYVEAGLSSMFEIQRPGSSATWFFYHVTEGGGTGSRWQIGYDVTGGTTCDDEDDRTAGANYENVVGSPGAATSQLWIQTDMTANIICNNGVQQEAPWSWFLACRVSTTDSSGTLFYDGLRGYDSSDTDPYVVFGDDDVENVDGSGTIAFGLVSGDMGGTWRYLGVIFGNAHGAATHPNGLPVNPGSGDDVLTVATYADPGVGWKGTSRWLLVLTETTGRNHGATYDIDTDGDGVDDYQCTRFGDLCFPSASGAGGTYDALVTGWAE